ncbi:MAG: TonB-dependent receptor [Chitinophagaceae bacterium]|nr:TonB-dependent receptor [Chitinophagaceae bacterium]
MIVCSNAGRVMPILLKKLLFLLFTVFALSVAAQVTDKEAIQLSKNTLTVGELFKELEQKAGYSFVYTRLGKQLEKIISLPSANTSAEKVLNEIAAQSDLRLTKNGKQVAVQLVEKGKIKGKVSTSDGQPAEGVSITLSNSLRGTSTNAEGEFELNGINEGKQIISASYIGLATQQVTITVSGAHTTAVSIVLKEDANTLQEVIVNSGTQKITNKETEYVARMPLKNLENPQVYSVIGQQIIKAQVATDVKDVLRNATGAAIANYPSGGFSITTRGFGTTPSSRNGMEMNSGRSTIDLANIERIEVLKGPSGTLFGADVATYGGVVNIVTKNPFETTRTEVSYTAGSFNLHRITADVNTALNEDKTVLLRVNAAISKRGSFQNYGFSNDYQVAPSLSYKVNNRLNILLDAELTGSRRTLIPLNFILPSSGFSSTKDIPLGYSANLFNNELDSKSSSTRIFAQANYEISKSWKSTTLFAYAVQNVERNYQPGLTWFSPTEAARDAWVYGPITENVTSIQQNFTGGFSTGFLKHKLLVGGGYRVFSTQFQYAYMKDWGYLDTVDIAQNSFPAPVTREMVDDNIVIDAGYGSPSYETLGVYVSDVINISDRVYAMLSLRLDRYKRNPVNTWTEFKQTSLSPKLGLVYQVVKDRVAVFGNYMNGFRNQAPITQPNGGGLFMPDPVYANQLEFGVKVEAVQKKANITLSYYRIAIANAIRYTTDYTALQDGKQLSSGFEGEVTANPVAGLNIIVGYAYNFNRFTKATDETVIGKQVASMPKSIANFWLNYTLQGAVKGLGFGVGGNYSDKAPYFSWSEFVTPAYTLIDATVYYEQSRFRAGLKFNNLTNQKYWDLMGSPQMRLNVSGNITLRF